MVTSVQIKKLCPSADQKLVDAIVANWDYAQTVGGITTPLREQHFFAQIATETGGLSILSESLNYTVEGLLSTFGRHRISEADAKKYGRTARKKADQEAIGNIIYGGDWGLKNLGNTQPDDGWRYRGGGMMQTTGRANYRKMGYEDNPDGLRDPVTAFKTAVQEWANRGCNALAESDDVVAVRRKINGGTNGLKEARAYLAKAKTIFTVESQLNTSAPKAVKITQNTFSDPGSKSNAPQDDKLIERVQDLLWDKGYPEVGESDNEFGNRTRNAILAFQADNNLPLTGTVSDDLLANLVKAPKREMADARQSATAKDLKAEPIVQSGDILKKAGTLLIGGSALGGGINSLDDINTRLTSLQGLVTTIQSFGPWLLGIGVGGLAIYFGSRVIKKYVEAYREGRAL